MKTSTAAIMAGGRFTAPAMNYFMAPQIAFAPPNDDGTKTAQQLADELKADHKKAVKDEVDKVRGDFEEFIGKSAKDGKIAEAIKHDVDEKLTTMNAKIDEVMNDFEQKMARIGSGDGEEHKSAGDLFLADERVANFLKSEPSSGKIDLRLKATLTSLTTDAAGSVGDAIAPTRLPGILPLPQRRLTVRDLLSQGRMDGNALEYVKETGFVNNAAPVAEGAAKPSSDIKLDLVTTSAKVIAHWMKASKQVLSDISQLRSIIDQRLLYGLAYVEEAQLLNGDGTGQNLNGIIPQATAYAAPITVASPTSIDLIRLMALQAALAEYPATGIVMNPADWAWVELLKDTTGRYIIGNPQGGIAPTLWGLPVVATQAMTIDKVLVGAFRLGAQVFDRWDARVETGFVNDDFTKNLVTILAEERLALAVYRPEAFIYGDFGRVT